LMQDETRLQRLSEDGRLRLTHIKDVLTAAFAAQGRMPIRRWLESTWLQLGGGKCLVDAGDNRDVQVFFDLVEKVSRSGQLDIAALELSMQKLYAKPDIEADDSLQFLTIHKSKGLEFDTVILPALNRKPRSGDNDLVLWQEVTVDHQLHLIAAPLTAKNNAANKSAPNIYDFLKNIETERNDNEIVRLLYVAATRAERQLHLIATMQANTKGELKPASRSLLEVLWPAVAADFSQAEPLASATSLMQTMDIGEFKPQLQRLPTNEFSLQKLDVLGQQTAVSSAFQPQLNKPVESFSELLVGADIQRHCGTLAHLYMELFATTDLQTWNAERLQRCQPAMQKWLMQQGHSAELAQQGAAQVLAALQVTLSGEAGQWILKNHTDAASELSLMRVEDADIKNHVIDRTFVESTSEGKQVRWIVDYKLTHLEEGVDLVSAAEKHRPQLERYAGVFNAEGLPIKKAVLFLAYGQLVELS
jgi:ATP-dependent helicase/nuclease subunit A